MSAVHHESATWSCERRESYLGNLTIIVLYPWPKNVRPLAHPRDRRLAAAGALTVTTAVMFSALARFVAERRGGIRLDDRILADVVACRTSVLTPLSKVVTTLGTGPVAYAIVLLPGVLASGVPGSRARARWLPVGFAVAVLTSGQLVRLAINVAIARPRPPRGLWLMHAGGYAFPSGHTTTATFSFMLAAGLIARRWPQRRAVLFTTATLCALAVGVSRVYLAVHWPTDVVGGWLFAASWLGLWWSVPRFARHVRQRDP